MIGGCDENGDLVYNEITDMIIRAYSRERFVNPKLNCRVSQKSPHEYLLKISELILTGVNSAVVENDDVIIPMLMRMGVSVCDARLYVGCGCQEVTARNQLHSRAFVYINLPLVLLDTLNGAPKESYGSGFRSDSSGFGAVVDSFFANLRLLLEHIADVFRPYEADHEKLNPEPIYSTLVGDCIERGLDYSDGGALYVNKTFSFTGFGTLCDSLLSLQKAYSAGNVDTLLASMRDNFASVPYRAPLSPNERWGACESANEFAVSLSHRLAHITDGIKSAAKTFDGHQVYWQSSLFPYYLFKWQGDATPATPDGRRANTEFSRAMMPAMNPDIMRSAAAVARICDDAYRDVGVFDAVLPGGKIPTDAVAAYISGCVKLGIPVVQLSVLNREMMLEERSKPGTHPELTVRICGFSVKYGILNRSMQDELIRRIED